MIVECNVCGKRYKNHAGSTPCCGSIAFIVDIEKEKYEKLMKIRKNKLNKLNKLINNEIN